MVMQKRMYLTADKSQDNSLIVLKVFEVFYITIKTAAEHKVFLWLQWTMNNIAEMLNFV